jgi:hypothetical protein
MALISFSLCAPGRQHTSIRTITSHSKRYVVARAADHIKAFARCHGISPRAVNYDLQVFPS